MPGILSEFRILGVHRVIPTPEEFAAAVESVWGQGFIGDQRTQAEQHFDQHFSGLYLVEVEIAPSDAEVDWREVTQSITGVDQSSWQVPYDEQPVDAESGRWAFFLHSLQLDRPLMTPVGPRDLPAATAMPSHLMAIRYEVP
jgi:hypothetical protein